MVNESEYCIRYIDLPCSVRAFTVEDNGFYNIYVNSRHCYSQNVKSIKHELEHINKGDFDCSLPIDALENKRHFCIQKIICT